MWKRLSIRHKVLALVSVVVASMGSGLVGMIMVGAEHERQREAVGTVRSLSMAVDTSLRSAMLSGDREVVRSAAVALAEQSGVTSVAVFDQTGRQVILAGDPTDTENTVDRLMERARASGRGESAAIAETSHAIVSPVVSEAECARCHGESAELGFISAVVSTAAEQKRIEMLRNRLLWGGLLLLAATFVAIRQAVSRWVERPIVELTHLVEGMRDARAPGDPTTRSNDEVARLTQSFTAMVKEIENKTESLLAVERDLAQSQRIVSIGLFAAGIAHEIAAPLSAIQLQADFWGSRSEGAVREAATAIKRATSQIAKHQRDLLSFDRRDTLSFTECRLADLLHRCCHLPDYPGVEVVLHTPAAPLTAAVDEELLLRAFSNILINAARAMAGDGRLEVSLRRVADNRAEITIRDSGPGISAEDLPYVFEPFFTREDGTRGRGLGLAIAREIVVRHGGEISAETTPDGACFRILLPLTVGEEDNGAHLDS